MGDIMDESDISTKNQILNYIVTKYRDESKEYFRARDIAFDLNLQSRQVGAYLGQFYQDEPKYEGHLLKLIKYSKNKSRIVWFVSIKGLAQKTNN